MYSCILEICFDHLRFGMDSSLEGGKWGICNQWECSPAPEDRAGLKICLLVGGLNHASMQDVCFLRNLFSYFKSKIARRSPFFMSTRKSVDYMPLGHQFNCLNIQKLDCLFLGQVLGWVPVHWNLPEAVPWLADNSSFQRTLGIPYRGFSYSGVREGGHSALPHSKLGRSPNVIIFWGWGESS